jgi:tRNA nucleotidyltransferase (CCA-adding enzyme)
VASAVEDAWRRDLTINALYYNINTNQVEDWTEQGLNDLLLQTVATPRKPLPTLLEDPMRILRAIRFAAQLSFDMSPALIKAARDERVRYQLRYKVSRDAIGGAIDDMFGTRARDPTRGIKLLMATNLIDVVFPLAQEDGMEPMTIYQSGLEQLARTQSLVTRIFSQSPNSDWDISKRRFLWYAAFFKPVYEMASLSNYDTKRDRRQDSAFYQLLDALKRPKADIQSIESILKGVDPIRMLLEGVHLDAIQSAINAQACLKDVSPQNSQWKELSELRWILYSTLKPIGKMWKEALILSVASSQKSLPDCVYQYNDLVSLIEDQLYLGMILLDDNKPKPLLNGSQIQKALPGVSGQGFKRIVQAIEEWQIRNSCYYLDTDDERTQTEAQLIDYLVASFPENANSTRATTC